MPLGDLFHKKELGIPWFSLLLFANCLLVSVACSFFPGLYEVFAARAPMEYPWTVITTMLVHGWPGFGMVLHLGGNAVVLLTVGILAERLLGPTRMLCVAMFGGALFVLPIALSGGGGIGASWAVFPFGFIALSMLIMEYKKQGKEIFKDPMVLVMIFTLFLMWVFSVLLITSMVVYSWDGANLLIRILLGIAGGIAWHLVPNIVGLAFALVWRKKIRRRMELVWAGKEWKIDNRYLSDKLVIGAMGGLLGFNIFILFLVAVGVIPY